MSKSEAEDSKAKFRAALEKKNQFSKGQNSGSDTDSGGRINKESSGKTPKMFRRKSS